MAILAAGINFGKPNTEFIVESDENGVAQSCRNVDTGVEYVGGGGSSDFSTAEVTIIGDGNSTGLFFPLSYIDNNTITTNIVTTESVTETFIIPLYKGSAVLNLLLGGQDNVATTGDVIFDSDTYLYTVTGDCSITIRPAD